MNYPFYTLCFASTSQVPDLESSADLVFADTILNVERLTYDQYTMASMVIYQASPSEASIVKNRWGASVQHAFSFQFKEKKQ